MIEEREIHLRDYLRVISKRRYTVYTFFAIVVLVTVIGTFSATSIYRASTKVLIEKVAEPYSLAVMYPYYSQYDPEFYETQYQLIKSTSVARKVVKMLSLEETYGHYFKDMKIPDGDEKTRTDFLADMINRGIDVTPVKNSKVVNVSFTSPNPEFAALVANSVAKAYIEEMLEMRMAASKLSIEWMSKKAGEEKGKLEKSERALQEYMQSNNIVTLQDKVALTPEKLSEINTQLVRSEARRKELESLYRTVANVAARPREAETIPAIATDPTVQSLRNLILRAEQNREELSKKYGVKHPAMLKAEEELRILEQKRDREIKRVVSSIRNEYELSRSTESGLRGMMSNTKAEALNLNEKFIQYGVLTREVETNRQLYDALVKRMKEQSVTEELRTVNVWVVEQAEKPAAPVKPRKMLNILLGLLVGLFGGVGLSFFIDYLDNTIKSPDDVERRLGQPVLGMVPLLEQEQDNIEEIVLKDPQSIFAESYKTMRTAILLSSAAKPPQNIHITSIGPDEGKTVTSVNLAFTIARSGYSVLLVDADLRKPRIHTIFSLNNLSGLSTCLAGATPDIETLLKRPVTNLAVIPSGPVPPNPSELLGSQRMNELIKELNAKFDVIVWDSPPLLSVTDSHILSKMLDGTVIVVKAGKTTYEFVERGLKVLQGRKDAGVGSPVLGFVLNCVDLKKNDQYYYQYYGYYSPSREVSK